MRESYPFAWAVPSSTPVVLVRPDTKHTRTEVRKANELSRKGIAHHSFPLCRQKNNMTDRLS